MENISLTHRIVGAIVILSLAIIFIPVLLETDQINPGNITESPVPPIPAEIETIVFELDEKASEFKPKSAEEIKQFEQTVRSKIDSSTKEIEQTHQSESGKQARKEKTETFPVDVDTPFEHTWMLQLASFKDKDKATDFRNRLRGAGYSSHLDERGADSGSIWRVRVGPYARKDEAQSVLGKINKEYRVDGILIQRR